MNLRRPDLASEIMDMVSNGMYFLQRNPDEGDSFEDLQKHLCDLDYVFGKIDDNAFWSIYQRNKWGRFAEK